MAKTNLDYEKNRLSYLELLRPEDGYMVDSAVCMTYSLDFDALIGGLLSFDRIGDPNSNVSNEEIYLLDCIQRNVSKVAVFCNAGNIKMPRKQPQLYHMLLENSIFPIQLGKKTNFHPKLWVVRYEKEDNREDSYFNIVVLSRNLTFDSSLDIAIKFTGEEGSGKRVNNTVTPIIDLMMFVSGYAGTSAKNRIFEMADRLQYIKRLDADQEYDELAFLPYGFGEYKNNAAGEYRDAKELIVVSPFVTSGITKILTNNVKKATLITRKYSLDERIYKMFTDIGGVWILRDEMMDDSVLEERTDEVPDRRDIHAKIIYEKMYDNRSYLYVGSLNATANSFYHNIELMVRLRYPEGKLSYKKIYDTLLPETNNPFQLLESFAEPGEIEEKEDDDELYDVISAAIESYVVQNGDLYNVHIRFGVIKEAAQIAMFGRCDNWKAVEAEVVFESVSIQELSSLFIIKRGSKRTIIIVPLRDFSVEERNAAIVRTMIDSTDKLLSYISIMMSDDYVLDCKQIKELGKKRSQSPNDSNDNETFSAVIYEKLLRLAAFDRERIKYIKKQIETLVNEQEAEAVVDSILELIKTCEKAIDRGAAYYED